MKRSCQTLRRQLGTALAGMALAFVTLGAVACDEPGPAPPRPPRSHSANIDPLDDPRIGRGVAAELRSVGIEHNRMTLAMFQENRSRQHEFGDRATRCLAVYESVASAAQRSAAAVGASRQAARLTAVARAVLASGSQCSGLVPSQSLDEMLGDASVTASDDPDSTVTDAALRVIDEMISRMATATSLTDMASAIDAAAATSQTLHGLDRLAVQSAVSQSQGSLVLWSPGGPGWQEFQSPLQAQSVFKKRQIAETITAIGGLLAADAAGCRGAVLFLQRVVKDPQFLAAACFAAAAASTVYATYVYVNME